MQALHQVIKTLEQYGVPYQISGGLAARLYGATRPLADIDIGVPRPRLKDLAEIFKDYITIPLEHYEDEEWRCDILTIDVDGQIFEFFSADHCTIFNAQKQKWESLEFSLISSVQINYAGVEMLVIPKDQLIAYKLLLDRQVDRLDIAQMQQAQIA